MSTTTTWTDPAREQAFNAWLAPLAARHGLRLESLRPASADASFRRYFRIDAQDAGGASRIVMDAPPPQEDVRPFVHVAGLIAAAGLHGPELLAVDEAHGFLLLSDLGQQLYLDALRQADAAQADVLMRQAIAALVQWQARVDASTLPLYDGAMLQRELALFPEWCVQREFGITWTDTQQEQWARVAALLTASALAQPRVAVHRDWMPRNLMVGEGGPRILDFQDAVRGPVSYDIASLLRDAFVSWDEEREIDWAVRYWQAAREAGVPLDGGLQDDFGEFWRAMEYMGLQRHLKVLGIFCRLKHRDGKPGYAADLPRFFTYATKVAMRYRQLQPLLPLLEPLSGTFVEQGYTF
ncbi:aminoglycoside phosphotransferase family protein [Azohydromonas lata]|uniref:Phosphotransferase n=1 Tax=Azohydromonas lata TaxID=45677 RepID=A0ABU5IBD4_9BURK|nr:phosphotransferase [Azohydromonas lata]MDZ5456419.1 phosphotransferase [Azohydromonas lata]